MSRLTRQMDSTMTGIVMEGVVERCAFGADAKAVQVTCVDDGDAAEMPIVAPQGVAFRIPEGRKVVVVNAMADGGLPSCIGTEGRDRPTEKPGGGAVPEGAGGLHYLGTWGVYLGDDGKTYLGGATSSDEYVALATKVLSELNDIRTKFDAHIHTTTATVGASTTVGVIAPPSPGMGAAGSVAATNTKAK